MWLNAGYLQGNDMLCSEVQFGKIEFDWWKTIEACEKLPNVHIIQWFSMFWLDFGCCCHSAW